MEIRIGILNAPRELSFETDESVSDVEGKVNEALSGKGLVLALTDSKGAQYLVPVAGIAYVQVGAEETRRVGFVA